MAIKHTIRIDGKGNMKEVSLVASSAIKHHCNECMGFEKGGPNFCTSPNCALFPFRTLRAKRAMGNVKKRNRGKKLDG